MPDNASILKSLRASESATGLTGAFYRKLVVGGGHKDLYSNVKFRLRLLKACSSDDVVRQAVWTMCSRDILFWINCFAWTYDPRNSGNAKAKGLRKLPKYVPFVSWDYQDDAILLLQHCILTGRDCLIEKSRDMGASWLFVLVFDWFFLFRDMPTFLMVSRKEALVDKKEDPDSLFWKIDFIHSRLPGWMLPEVSRSNLHLKNMHLGGTIDGDSTTGDVGRGGRRTAIGLDEFAAVPREEGFAVLNATNDTTDCRVFNSTPQGIGSAYYEQVKRDDIVRVQMHWTLHPHKREGLYTCEKGKCPIHPEGGKPHSPWYDYECKRRGYNAAAIAQELDIEYSMAGGAYFNSKVIEDYISSTCRPYVFVGELEYDHSTGMPGSLVERDGGDLRLWVHPTMAGRLDPGEYGVACDISEGTGASYSCLSFGNLRTGEKLGEFASPLMKPYEFARLAVAMCRFLGVGTRLAWEANGPGREFGDEVTGNLGYTDVWWRRNFLTKSRSAFPGWMSTQDEKVSLFGSYRMGLAEGSFLNRSKAAMKETFKYVTNANGVPEYIGAAFNPGKIGQSHGDIVVADALLNMLVQERRASGDEESMPAEIPENCWAERLMEHRRSADGTDGNWRSLQFI